MTNQITSAFESVESYRPGATRQGVNKHTRSASLSSLGELQSKIAIKVESGSITLLRGSTLPVYHRFINARKEVEMRSPGFLSPISLRSLTQNNIAITLDSQGRGGYGISETNELVSLFSKGGMGKRLVKDAILQGADHLHCFDSRGLPGFYQSQGFIVDKRYAWDEAYAPPNWDYEAHGRPDLVHMSLKADTLVDTRDRP